jgi:hypothetical protein
MFIPDPDFFIPDSKLKKAPDPGVRKIQDIGSGSATLQKIAEKLS